MNISGLIHETTGIVLALAGFAGTASALPVLAFPTANDLVGPVFIQPFAGLSVGAGGVTDPFFSDLPDGSLPCNYVVNILGNFQAFGPDSSPTALDILGVEVTDGGMTFRPDFGQLDFAGNASLTFNDSVDFDSVTFLSGDLTLAFAFTAADAALDYSYVLTTNLESGSFLFYDDVQTGIPEPSTLVLVVAGLGAFLWRRHRTRRFGPDLRGRGGS